MYYYPLQKSVDGSALRSIRRRDSDPSTADIVVFLWLLFLLFCICCLLERAEGIGLKKSTSLQCYQNVHISLLDIL